MTTGTPAHSESQWALTDSVAFLTGIDFVFVYFRAFIVVWSQRPLDPLLITVHSRDERLLRKRVLAHVLSFEKYGTTTQHPVDRHSIEGRDVPASGIE